MLYTARNYKPVSMLEATKTVADGELCAHVAGFAEGLLAPFTFSQLLDRYGIAGINEEVFDEESEACRHHDVAAMDVRFYVALVPLVGIPIGGGRKFTLETGS